MVAENTFVGVVESFILDKYEGDPVPNNLFERLHITEGQITKVERFENGVLIEEKEVD